MSTSLARIEVKAFAFTGYPVTDLLQARAFYENVLGLKPVTTWVDGAKGWIEYELGDSTLALTNGSAETWRPASAGPALALEVADFGAAIAALREAGVRFKVEPVDFELCRFAIVLDPDGNQLAIHQRKGG